MLLPVARAYRERMHGDCARMFKMEINGAWFGIDVIPPHPQPIKSMLFCAIASIKNNVPFFFLYVLFIKIVYGVNTWHMGLDPGVNMCVIDHVISP